MKDKEKPTPKFLKEIERSLQDSREGRTYILSCTSKYQDTEMGVCKESNQTLTICPKHHIKECDKWYRIGRKDGQTNFNTKLADAVNEYFKDDARYARNVYLNLHQLIKKDKRRFESHPNRGDLNV